MRNKDLCRVCGYESDVPPWGEDGLPLFDICPCCGVEWGYEDALPAGVKQYRENWISRGAPWFDRYTARDGLETSERLRRLSVD